MDVSLANLSSVYSLWNIYAKFPVDAFVAQWDWRNSASIRERGSNDDLSFNDGRLLDVNDRLGSQGSSTNT